MAKKWIIHRAKARRYRKGVWRQRHKVGMLPRRNKIFGQMRQFPRQLPDDREIASHYGQIYDNIKHMPKTMHRLKERYKKENFGSSPHLLETSRKKLAREFFTKRFNKSPESDPLYFQEWETRINTYDPKFLEGTADSESMKVLRQIKKKYPAVHVPGLQK